MKEGRKERWDGGKEEGKKKGKEEKCDVSV